MAEAAGGLDQADHESEEKEHTGSDGLEPGQPGKQRIMAAVQLAAQRIGVAHGFHRLPGGQGGG